MSQQEFIKLVKLVESDDALLGEMRAAKTFEEKAAIAANHGCDVRAEEIAAVQKVAGQDSGGELSDTELDMVAGGGIISFIKSVAKKVKEVFYVDGSDGKKVVGVKGKF